MLKGIPSSIFLSCGGYRGVFLNNIDIWKDGEGSSEHLVIFNTFSCFYPKGQVINLMEILWNTNYKTRCAKGLRKGLPHTHSIYQL